MVNATDTTSVSTRPYGVGDAVGVEKTQWFVAIVNHNTEKRVAEKLTKLGITNYLPIQTEFRTWKNGRKAKVDRVVIPSTVFINCTEQQRREIVTLPFINRFMTDKAGSNLENGRKPLASIPNYQIETLQFMIGHSNTPVNLSDTIYKKGDWVKVIRGNLIGLEGEIQAIDSNHSEIIVRIDFLGTARLTIDTINVVPIDFKE